VAHKDLSVESLVKICWAPLAEVSQALACGDESGVGPYWAIKVSFDTKVTACDLKPNALIGL
jgi:hypothetical protein